MASDFVQPGRADSAAALALYRAVDDRELASILEANRFAPAPNGFGEKQFWLSPNAARAFAAMLSRLGYGDQTVVQTALGSRTASLGRRMLLDGQAAISFPLAALAQVNAEAARSGITVLGRNGA